MLDCATDPALAAILLPGDRDVAVDGDGPAPLGWTLGLLALALASVMIPWP